MTTTRNLICFKCKHFKPIGGGCEAFEDIPNEILVENDHSKPLPDQKNDIVFEEGDPNKSFFRN